MACKTLESPFMNDPFALVAMAFKRLYPGLEFDALIVPELKDENGSPVCGETVFPEDGSKPCVEISGAIPLAAAVEILAHELAHVAAPDDQEHGKRWKAAFDQIFEEYNKIAEAQFGMGSQEES